MRSSTPETCSSGSSTLRAIRPTTSACGTTRLVPCSAATCSIEGSTVVVPGTRGGDLAAYLASLARVASLGPAIVLPAHGPDIEDPAALIERYSAHRAAREREVLSAILGGAASVEAIVQVVYPTLAEAMRPVAVETVHAHLNKLRDEGRVADAGGRLQVIV